MCEAIEKLIEEFQDDKEKETILTFLTNYRSANPNEDVDTVINFATSMFQRDKTFIESLFI